MAYVAITKELTTLTTRKIDNMAVAELSTLPDPSTLLQDWLNSKETSDLLENRLWEPVMELRQQLQQYTKFDAVLVKVLYDNTNIHTDRKLNVPCIYQREDRYSTYLVTIKLEESENETTRAVVEAARNRREVTARWEAVKKQVVEFLSSCKSLNEAVKLWPDVVRYVPKQHLDRLQVKTEKAERTSNALDALRKLDLDTINTSTVLARMAGAAA